MLDNKGFDLWADGYDKAVGLSDEGNTYPFAGYKNVLGTIYKTIMEKPKAVVLDIGFGTGTAYACSDELHQLSIDGRSGQWTDVLVDGSGVLTGVVLGTLLIKAMNGKIMRNDYDSTE